MAEPGRRGRATSFATIDTCLAPEAMRPPPVPPARAVAALALLLALAALPAPRTGCHRSQRRAPRGGARARGRAADGDRSAGALPRDRPRRRARLAAARPFLSVRRPRLAPARPSGRSRRSALSGLRRDGARPVGAALGGFGLVFRGVVDVDRALGTIEDSGWDAGRWAHARPDAPSLPAYIVELGANLLTSCPSGGVLLTGSDLETVSVWYGSLQRVPFDILPLRPDLYATDSVYRLRMATAMGVDPALPVQRALAAVAVSRAICLSPNTDLAAAPALAWSPFRMVRVSRAGVARTRGAGRHRAAQGRAPGRFSLDERRARGLRRAARYNTLLCSSLLMFFGDTPPAECR